MLIYMTTQSIWEDEKHPEWAALARRTEPFVDRITGRNDIYVIVKPDMRPAETKEKDPTPAGFFTPSFARIQFTPEHIFDTNLDYSVEAVDPTSITSQRKYPKYVGVVAHESAHGRHSNYPLPPLEGKIAHWIAMIEEPRAERWMLEDFPQYAVYIRSMVTDVLGGDKFFNDELFKDADGNIPPELKALQDRYQAAQLCLLVMARADTGVFEYDDLEESEIILRGILGDDDYDAMHKLWLQAIDLEDDQVDEIIDLAHQIQDLVDPNKEIEDQPEEESATSPCGASMPSDADADDDGDDDGDSDDADSDAEGQGKPSSKRGKGKGKGSSSGGADDDEAGNDDENGDGSDDEGKDGEDKDSKDSDGSDGSEGKDGKDGNGSKPNGYSLDGIIHDSIRKEIADAAKKAQAEISRSGNEKGIEFAKNQPEIDAAHRNIVSKAKDKIQSAPSGGGGIGNGYGYYNRLTLNEVNPTSQDVSRARAMEMALRQAQYREVTKTVVRSVTPPGRLSMRGMMTREAQVAARQEITATPWAQTHRRMVDNPPITLAIATDISGSMDRYQREVGSFTWAFAHAIKRLQGKVGAVAWDSAVHEYIQPGKTTDLIPYYTNGGMSDGLPAAIFALDGLMNLSFGEGVRVLTVITDGQLPDTKKIQERINLLHSRGVQVLWILTGGGGFIPKNCTHATLKNTQEFGNIVGRKVIELLERA